jgi:DNA-binding NtrC family response regulator
MATAVEKEHQDPIPGDDATNQAHALEASRRILLVEDDEDTRQSFQQLLGMALGVDVDLAVDGAQALAMLLKQPYSIVITDLRMPKLDGMKLIEEIQTRRQTVNDIDTTRQATIKDPEKANRKGAYH